AKTVGLVAVDGSPQTVELQNDRQAHGDLGRRHGDDEEGEHLPVHRAAVLAVERDEGQVHAVEHQLDAHQLHQDVPARHEADGADQEDQPREQHVVFDDEVQGHHACSFPRLVGGIMPPPGSACAAGAFDRGRSASRGSSGPWNKRSVGFSTRAGFRWPGCVRATAMAPITATMSSAVTSSNTGNPSVKMRPPTASMDPCPSAAAPNFWGFFGASSTSMSAPSSAMSPPAKMRDTFERASALEVNPALGPSSITTNTNRTTTAPAYTMS